MSAPTPAPGAAWIEILSRPSLEAFAAAFVAEPRLDALALPHGIVGVAPVRAVFRATRGMYQQLAFVEETRSARRTVLEWQGRFLDADIDGVTVLSHAPGGAIARIQLYHHPRGALDAFAAELQRRLEADFGPDLGREAVR